MGKDKNSLINELSYFSSYYGSIGTIKDINLYKVGVIMFDSENKILTKDEFNKLNSDSLSDSISN